MAKKNKNKAAAKTKRTWKKKMLDEPVSAHIVNNNNTDIFNNNTYKNTLLVYKDKTTTRVTYDSSSDEYITVYMNN